MYLGSGCYKESIYRVVPKAQRERTLVGETPRPEFDFYPPLTSPKTSSEKLLNLSALVFPQPQER